MAEKIPVERNSQSSVEQEYVELALFHDSMTYGNTPSIHAEQTAITFQNVNEIGSRIRNPLHIASAAIIADQKHGCRLADDVVLRV